MLRVGTIIHGGSYDYRVTEIRDDGEIIAVTTESYDGENYVTMSFDRGELRVYRRRYYTEAGWASRD